MIRRHSNPLVLYIIQTHINVYKYKLTHTELSDIRHNISNTHTHTYAFREREREGKRGRESLRRVQEKEGRKRRMEEKERLSIYFTGGTDR